MCGAWCQGLDVHGARGCDIPGAWFQGLCSHHPPGALAPRVNPGSRGMQATRTASRQAGPGSQRPGPGSAAEVPNPLLWLPKSMQHKELIT